MSIELTRSFLLWCTVISYGILLLWFLDVLLAEHKSLETKTKTALARATAAAAEHASTEPPLEVRNPAHLRDLAASAVRIFGWDKTDKPGVQLNQQFCISQEQLEQIRQLRAVPEPDQLQERKNDEL
jgi:hypothetical protein